MFSEREIQDIQDQLKAKAIAKAERTEELFMNGARIVLRRCTMCACLDRQFISPDDETSIENLIRNGFTDPRIHSCLESAGEHRKYGILIPVGVLSKW